MPAGMTRSFITARNERLPAGPGSAATTPPEPGPSGSPDPDGPGSAGAGAAVSAGQPGWSDERLAVTVAAGVRPASRAVARRGA